MTREILSPRALQALYAYVHTLRSFNGDWSWDPLEAAVHMFHLGRSIWVRAGMGGFGGESTTDVEQFRRQGRQVYDSVTEALQVPQSLAWRLSNGESLRKSCLKMTGKAWKTHRKAQIPRLRK